MPSSSIILSALRRVSENAVSLIQLLEPPGRGFLVLVLHLVRVPLHSQPPKCRLQQSHSSNLNTCPSLPLQGMYIDAGQMAYTWP